MITIRPFDHSDADYTTMVDLHNTIWPEHLDTVEEWKENDARRAAKLRWARFLAEVDGEAVGYAGYGQSLWMYHPRKFWVHVNVLAEHRRRGIGSALYAHVLAELEQYDPLTLFAGTREDQTGGLAFLASHGYAEVMREWESRLDPSRVDLSQYAGLDEKMARAGIEIRTVRELEADPERDRKLYDLDWALDQDVPSPEPPTRVPYEEWQKVWQRSNLLPDGWFVAVHDGRYVGTTNLWSLQATPDTLETGLTGVLRSYRRQGIATALKLRAVAYAQSRGIREVRTWNASNNVGMLSINIALGFVRQPASIDFVKHLKEETEDEKTEAVVAA